MNLNRILAIVLVLCALLSLCACGDTNTPVEETPDVPVNTPVEDEKIPENDSEETPGEDEEPTGVVYTVTVTDEGGNPVSGAMIQLCQGEMCLLPAATNAEGVVTFNVAEEAAYEAKFLALPAGFDYTTEEQVFHFNGATELTIVLKAVA